MTSATNNLPRIFVNDSLQQNGIHMLNATQTHYLKNVLRKKIADEIRIFNGKDGEWLANINTIQKNSSSIKISKLLHPQPPQKSGLILCFAPIKNHQFQYLIQKATELGISAFQPIQTQRTIINKINAERINANIIEASEQCERLDIPQLQPMTKLSKFLQQISPENFLLFADESTSEQSLKHCPADIFAQNSAYLLIGPEGGFTEEERELIRTHRKTFCFGLGPRILRAETAAISAIAYLQIQLGDCTKPPRSIIQ